MAPGFTNKSPRQIFIGFEPERVKTGNEPAITLTVRLTGVATFHAESVRLYVST